jgi:hypothetical protein
MDRPHHVGGIHRVDQMGDDAVHLLPHVYLLFGIVVVDQNHAIRRSKTNLFRFAVFMNDNKPPGGDSHHASILLRDDAGHFAKPFLCSNERKTPGPWTTVAAATIQKPITLSGLTPTTT